MRERVIVQVLVLSLTVIATPILGDSFDDFGRSDKIMRNEPVFQAGVVVGFRLDDLSQYTYVPSVGGNFYYFFHPMIALRAGLSHNSLTRLSPDVSYHTVIADVGMRFNTSHTQIVPFLETGFSFPYVWGVNKGYEYADFQPGGHIGVGLSMRVSRSLAFDLSVTQIINRFSTKIDAVMIPGLAPSAPCPLGVDCPPFRQEPEGAFNPAMLDLVFRFSL